MRKLLKTLLSANGYGVVEASNGNEAIQACRRFKGDIPLILTDVVMPGIKGTDLVEQVVDLRPGIKVIYMSGYPGEHVRPDPNDSIESIFMEKPIRPEKLLHAIRAMLDEYTPRF